MPCQKFAVFARQPCNGSSVVLAPTTGFWWQAVWRYIDTAQLATKIPVNPHPFI